MQVLIRLLGVTAWSVAVVVIGLGVGGAGAAMNPVPDQTTRPELFAPAERALAPALAALTADIDALDVPVEGLATTARAALVDLSATDAAALQRDLSSGDALVVQIGSLAARVQADIDALPYHEGTDLLGAATEARIAASLDAVDAALPLTDLWSRLSASTVPTTTLTTALAAHDAQTFAAVQKGAAGDFAGALEGLAAAGAQLDTAQAVRDQIRKTVDTSTLDQWIARNRAYDAALVSLYKDLVASKGKPTAALAREGAAVEAAQQLLPPDTRALIVIIGDLAQGGLNQAAIAIEEARGALADAVVAVH
jgi:hypothetical protein